MKRIPQKIRRKPVTRDEIRIETVGGKPRLLTMPIDAAWLYEESPNGHLWQPLLAELAAAGTKLTRQRWYYERECIRCKREFRGGATAGYCSNKCADAVRLEKVAAYVKRRSEDRARDRENICDYCHQLMQASRSTKKFCSPRCRAAAYREAQAEAAELSRSA
jgi:hypothetical protein